MGRNRGGRRRGSAHRNNGNNAKERRQYTDPQNRINTQCGEIAEEEGEDVAQFSGSKWRKIVKKLAAKRENGSKLMLLLGLWKKKDSFWCRFLFIAIPFVLVFVLGVILVVTGAYRPKENFVSFVEDYTNCYMFCYVFFFMYFTSSVFVNSFNSKTEKMIDRIGPEGNVLRENYRAALTIIAFLAIFFICGAPLFVLIAFANGNELYWYSSLNNYELVYYGLLIGYAWYMTARLFLYIIVNSITTFYASRKISNDRGSIVVGEVKGGQKLVKSVLNHLSASMGFGIYFIIAIAMILYSDIRVHNSEVGKKNDIQFGVYEGRWWVVGITIVLSVFYFATVVISYIAASENLETEDDEDDNEQSGHKGKKKQPRIDKMSVGFFLLTVVFPGVAALIQVTAPLWKVFNLLNR